MEEKTENKNGKYWVIFSLGVIFFCCFLIFPDEIFLQDMRFPAQDLTTAAVNDPYREKILGYTTWSFHNAKYAELEADFQYPHIMDGFTTYVVSPHIHWTMNVNLTKKQCIVWGLTYSCANIGDYFYSPVTQKSQFCLSGRTQNLHIYSALKNVTVINRQNSRQCFFRVFRDGLNASDNLTQNALLLEFDIHYRYKKYGEIIE